MFDPLEAHDSLQCPSSWHSSIAICDEKRTCRRTRDYSKCHNISESMLQICRKALIMIYSRCIYFLLGERLCARNHRPIPDSLIHNFNKFVCETVWDNSLQLKHTKLALELLVWCIFIILQFHAKIIVYQMSC